MNQTTTTTRQGIPAQFGNADCDGASWVSASRNLLPHVLQVGIADLRWMIDHTLQHPRGFSVDSASQEPIAVIERELQRLWEMRDFEAYAEAQKGKHEIKVGVAFSAQ